MPTTMPAVFVHGVPDTSRVWQAVIARLPRPDVVTLSLPGFGRPTPDGFDATKEAYVRWLLDELAAQPGPIDVVGHDWGALLVVRAISLAPDRVRSWRWVGPRSIRTTNGIRRPGCGRRPRSASG
jgi:pimeloyl-ACP methyl ester carboxylesterase